MVRRGGMRTQMARQMGVSKNKADELLEKAKKMNDAEGFNKGGSSMAKKFPDLTGDGKTTYADILGANVSRETFNPVEEITPGPKDIKVEMNRQVRNQEIKGTPPVQVKGRKFSGVY